MGKKPDQIEQDIRQQRQHISRRMEDLQHRVQEDIASVQEEAKGRAALAVDDAKGKLQDVQGTLKIDNLKGVVEEHTMSTMAGAVGAGVLLGMISEGLGGGGNGRSKDSGARGRNDFLDRRESSGSSGGGFSIGGMVASIVGPAATTAQQELQDLVREGFSVMKEQVQQVKEDKSDRDMLVRNRDVGVE